MPVSDRPELYAALGSGASGFDEICETPESAWIDFKQAPYQLDDKKAKLELAKDVSAFANVQGGVIIVGVKTRRLATEKIEVAHELTPVRDNLLDRDRIRKVIRQYVYPPIANLDCKSWPVGQDQSVLTIDVPRQDGADQPFIVSEGLSSDGDHYGNMFGYFRRDADTAQPVPPGVAHDLMRDGYRFRDWMSKGSVAPAAGDNAGRTEAEQAEVEERRLARAQEDAEAAGVEDEPHLIVQAWKPTGFQIKDIQGQFRNDFLRPPQVRDHGFNLDFTSDVEVLPGGGLRKTRSGGMCLSVLPEGLATMVVGSEVLGWAMKETWQSPELINSIPLVELIFEFCTFTHAHIRDKSGGFEISHQARMRRLDVSGARRLVGGTPGSDAYFYGLGNSKPPPVGATEVISEVVTGLAPPQAAFELLAQIYSNYGLPERAIPFANAENRSINKDELATR